MKDTYTLFLSYSSPTLTHTHTHTEKKAHVVLLLQYCFIFLNKHLSHDPLLIPLGSWRSDRVGHLNTNHPDVLLQQAERWTPVHMNQMFGKGAPKSAFLSGLPRDPNAQLNVRCTLPIVGFRMLIYLLMIKASSGLFFSSSELLNVCPHNIRLWSGTLGD